MTSVSRLSYTSDAAKSAKTARLSARTPFRLRVTLTWTFHLSGWEQELLMLAELSLCIKLLVLRFACESLRQPVVNVCLLLFFFWRRRRVCVQIYSRLNLHTWVGQPLESEKHKLDTSGRCSRQRRKQTKKNNSLSAEDVRCLFDCRHHLSG